MNVTASVALAIAAYFVPILVIFFARARRDRTLSEIALDIPLGVAADLLTILLLTLLMRLETAVFVSRALWLAGGGAFLWRRWRARSLQYPSALGVRELGPALGAAFLVVLVCSPISGEYTVWDSYWHTGLVAALPSQRLPFVNALEQREVLHYHFSGDVLAATLKVLSLHVMSANRALAVAHDLMFALTASSITLLVRARRDLRGWPVVLAGFGVLLHGPMPLRLGPHEFVGFSFHSFLNLSYRPHYPVSVLLSTGVISCVLTRVLGSPALSGRQTTATLLTIVAAMSITDESSLALLGLFLGMLWLVYPQAIAERRLRGFLVLASFPLILLAINFLFSAALAPGSPVQKITLTENWEVGGVTGGITTLDKTEGRWGFFWDFFPLASGWLALAVHTLRTRRRATFGLCVACGALILATALLSLRVSINGDHRETHRFFVAAFVVTALCAISCFGAMKSGSTARALVVLGVFVPAASQIYWLRHVAPGFYAGEAASSEPSENVFLTNCRSAAGARVGDTPRTAYVEASQFYRFSGCRPVFVSGRTDGAWKTKVLANIDWQMQLNGIEGELPERSQALDAVCRSNIPATDPVCAHVRKQKRDCKREGDDYVRCKLSMTDRNTILGR